MPVIRADQVSPTHVIKPEPIIMNSPSKNNILRCSLKVILILNAKYLPKLIFLVLLKTPSRTILHKATYNIKCNIFQCREAVCRAGYMEGGERF